MPPKPHKKPQTVNLTTLPAHGPRTEQEMGLWQQRQEEPHKKEYMLTEEQLPSLLSPEQREQLIPEQDIPVSLAQLEAQVSMLSKARKNIEAEDVTILSDRLYKLIHINVNSLTVDTYLEHAKKLVMTLKQLSVSLPRTREDECALLEQIYAFLKENGWHCTENADGLTPASPKKLNQFKETFTGNPQDNHFGYSDKTLIELTDQLHSLLRTNSPAAASTPRQKAVAAQSVTSDLDRLILKIKASESLFDDPIIKGNPTIRDNVNPKETHADDLGFTPLFYAAKYSTQPGSIARLLDHAYGKQEVILSLQSIISNKSNTYLGARPLMISAQFGSPNILKEILEQFPERLRDKEVNYSISKGPLRGWTALLFACNKPFNHSAIVLNSIMEKVIFLLDKGADINVRSKAVPQKDALALAIENNNMLLFRLLIKSKARPEQSLIDYNELVAASSLTDEEKQEIIHAIAEYRPTLSGLSPASSAKSIQPKTVVNASKRKHQEVAAKASEPLEEIDSDSLHRDKRQREEEQTASQASSSSEPAVSSARLTAYYERAASLIMAALDHKPAQQKAQAMRFSVEERQTALSDISEEETPEEATLLPQMNLYPASLAYIEDDPMLTPAEKQQPAPEFSDKSEKSEEKARITAASAEMTPADEQNADMPAQEDRLGLLADIKAEAQQPAAIALPLASAASLPARPVMSPTSQDRSQDQASFTDYQGARHEIARIKEAQQLAFTQLYHTTAGKVAILEEERNKSVRKTLILQGQIEELSAQLNNAQGELQERERVYQKTLQRLQIAKNAADNPDEHLQFNADGTMVDPRTHCSCHDSDCLQHAYAQAQATLKDTPPSSPSRHAHSFFHRPVQKPSEQATLAPSTTGVEIGRI